MSEARQPPGCIFKEKDSMMAAEDYIQTRSERVEARGRLKAHVWNALTSIAHPETRWRRRPSAAPSTVGGSRSVTTSSACWMTSSPP